MDLSVYDNSMLLESLKAPAQHAHEASTVHVHGVQGAPYARYPLKGKVQICNLSNVVNVVEASKHMVSLHPPRHARLTGHLPVTCARITTNSCKYSRESAGVFK
ncbi:hypothetical protein GN244_ATG21032 [Phytophthora infestans]|uniref:Uncharacterized protein n=1 Tax=Phytophthora infestans TaxID=4787 RepID=A0A833VT54_PHYIN|nr:hypothetical protein GN244_ATG21032 [Phytophthora infestans]